MSMLQRIVAWHFAELAAWEYRKRARLLAQFDQVAAEIDREDQSEREPWERPSDWWKGGAE